MADESKNGKFKNIDMELVELAAAECDGVLTDAEWQRLTQILREDPQAREQYVGFKVLHALLAAKQVSPLEEHTEEATEKQDSDFETAQPSATSTSHVSRATADSPSRKRSLAPRRLLRGLVEDFAQQPLASLLLCGALLAAALVAWQMPRGQRGNVARNVPENEKNDNGADQHRSDADAKDGHTEHVQRLTIARLGSTHNAEWGSQRTPHVWKEGETLAFGDRLVLEHGLAEIVYHTGATVLLEGPAELELGGTGNIATRNACSLALGKLVARVPESAHGFTVVTPTLTVIDKGTEFGVFVKQRDSGRSLQEEESNLDATTTEVQVIEGQVVVEQPAPLSAPTPQAIPTPEQVAQTPPKQIELSAGEGVVAEPGEEAKRTTDATRTTFVRQLHANSPLLPLSGWPADSPLKPGDIVAVSNTTTRFHLFKIDPATGEQKLLATGFPFRQAPVDHGLHWRCIAFERDGHVLVGASGIGGKQAGVLRINPRDTQIQVLASGGLLTQGGVTGLAVAADGTIYAAYEPSIHTEKGHVLSIDPDSGGVTQVARYGKPLSSLRLDTNGRDLLLTSSKAGLAQLRDAKVTPWEMDAKLGRFDMVVANRAGQIFVGAVVVEPPQQVREFIYEVNRAAPHTVKALAQTPNIEDVGSSVSIACEADGNLIVGPGGSKQQVYRVDRRTGKISIVSSRGMITAKAYLAVVPGRLDTSDKER